MLALAVIVAGIALRFSGLDRKLYSYDEATTSLRTAGYTLSDYYGGAFDGRVVKNSSFLAYQHVTGAKDADAAVRSLAVEDPQHPPLYYLLERAWSRAFGDTVAQRRAVSAIAGTLLLGAAFWLCVELFESIDAGLIGAALMAVSPFFVIYSQQAREYALWGLCIAVASACLLRAIRGETLSWLWYGAAVALGLYTDLIFAYVLAGHALYVAVIAVRERTMRPAVRFAIASAAALAVYAPWLLAVYRGRDLLTNNDYLGAALPAKIFLLKWAFNAGAVFFDLDYEHVASAVLLVPIFALVIAAFVALAKNSPPRVWVLIYTLAATTTLAFLVPDLLRHESRSTVARYLLPAWLAAELAVAYLLAGGLKNAMPFSRRLTSLIAFVALVLCGLASVSADARGETSWAEGKSIAGLGPIARIVNAAPQPTVVYIADPARFDFASLALSNELRPDAGIQQFVFGRTRVSIAGTPGTFVLDPTARVRDALTKSGLVLTQVYADGDAGPAAIRDLRAQTAAVRRDQGENVSGLALWSATRSMR